MELNLSGFIFMAGVIFLAGTIQGLSGFGSALVAVPLLSLILPLKTVIPLIALFAFLICIVLFIQLREHFSLVKLIPLAVGALFGIPMGVYFLKNFDEGLVKAVLGVVLLGYSLYSFLGRENRYNLSAKWGYLFGFLSGCLGGAFNTSGPPAVIYTTLQSWNKDEVKVTLQSYFICTNLLIISAHAASGLTTLRVLKYFIIFLPCVIIGVVSGSHIYRRINQATFKRIIYLLLFALGVLLLITR